MSVKPMIWKGDRLLLLDQRLLPQEESWLTLTSAAAVAEAIRSMAVRGAPAIGIAAAYGLALAAQNGEQYEVAASVLSASRPTAVNLFWAIERMSRRPHDFESQLAEAKQIEHEDLQMNLAIGENGAALLGQGARILTICNTGALATAGHGTALGIIRSAHSQGKGIHVYSCETRPRQQGLRLTAYELLKEGIPFQSIADGAAGALMADGRVDIVLAGADRVAANGDAANKIGTYSLAVLARHHGLPFVIAAPTSTIDPAMPNGRLIPIEERAEDELTTIDGRRIAPDGCPVYNPAFDVTPGELISAIVTEHGIHRSPYIFRA